ncbi:flagellar basal-body MS-ring/collar protein FliF [Vibrio breoganii]
MATEKGQDASGVKQRVSALVSKLGSGFAKLLSKKQRNYVAIALLAIFVSAVIIMVLYTADDRYRPLYGSSMKYDSSEVLTMLDEMKVEYRLSADTGQILVRENHVSRTRLLLAQKGLKEQLPSGFDQLVDSKSLGESQFMENARYLNALEGELARSISSLEQVTTARVHLAIPKNSLFARGNESRPKASVIVNLKSGTDLKGAQVDAIINLVSGAVIKLKETDVSVVDQYGRMLSDDSIAGDYTAVGSKQVDFKKNIESRLVTQASDVLTPILGAQNFRIQVAADVDFSRREETREIYDDPVVRSEVGSTVSNERQPAYGVPGSLSNTPPVSDADAATATTSDVVRNEFSKQYAVGTAVVHTQHQQGVVQALTVSVVLNEGAQEQPWSEEDLDQFGVVVKNAIGFVEDRDRISVSGYKFMPTYVEPLKELRWYQDSEFMKPIQYMFVTLITILLLVFGIRPLVQYLIGEKIPQDRASNSVAGVAEDGQTIANNGDSSLGNGDVSVEDGKLRIFTENLPSADSPVEVQMKHLMVLIEKDSTRVSEILQSWMEA